MNNNQIMQNALDLASKGMAVFPIVYGKKIPAIHNGFYGASKDSAEIKNLFAEEHFNVGIRTGAESGLIVIDDDSYKNDGKSIPALEAQHGKLPETLRATTRAGGTHYFFKHPGHSEVIKCSNGTLALAVDVKADGGYVVAAPSWVDADGKGSAGSYSWNNSVAVADLPQPWLDVLRGKSTPLNFDTARSDWQPNQNTINLTGNFYTPPNLVNDGQGRESSILRYGGSLRGQGFNQEIIEQKLLEYNQSHLNPPLDEKTVLERARRYATPTFETVTNTSGPDFSNGVIRISTLPPQPRDWVMEGILLSGKSVVLAGFGGVSKTQLCIHFAIAIATGKPYMACKVKHGKVMLLLGEEDEGEIGRRINAVVRCKNLSAIERTAIQTNIRGFGLVGEDIRLSSKSINALNDTGLSEKIIEAAKKLKDVRLIVLDHVALVHGGDFNAREDAALTMRIVNHIAQQTGASVLLLAHSPKGATAAEDSDSSHVAGSTAFVDQARGAMILATMRKPEAKTFGIQEEERTKYVSMTIVKNNYGPTGSIHWFKRISFDEVGLLEPENLVRPQAALKGIAAIEAAIHIFISGNPGRYSKTSLRDTQSGINGRFKVSKAVLQNAIENLLVDKRLVQRPPTDNEKKQFALGSRVSKVIDIAA